MPLNTNSDSPTQKRKFDMYSFKPFKLERVEAIGNQMRNIHYPTPRSGHRIVASEGNVYSYGGYNPIAIDETIEHILFKELWVYNCVSKTWRQLKTSGNAPDELASLCAAYFNNHVLIFGGTTYPFGARSSNDAHIYNLKSTKWSKLDTIGCLPSKQYGQAMALSGDCMYVVGGTTGYAYSNDVHCLNLSKKEWKLLFKSSKTNYRNYEPEPRYRHEIAIENNKIYVFGGGTATDSFELNELPVFNLEDNTWSKVSTSGSFISPRRCHSLVQVESDVYICGGLNGLDCFSDICRLNLKTLTWQKLEISLPYTLYFHAACLSESSQLFIFGGVRGDENCRTNDLHKMWLKIPSLSEISWQAMLHYVPHMSYLDKHKLFEVGIPIRYLNEVEFVSSESPVIYDPCMEPEDSDEPWELL